MRGTGTQIAYARAVSEVGNSLRYIALPLGIVAVRNRAEDLAIAEVLETLGFIISGLLAPFFIDRVSKIRALVFSDLLSLLATAAMVAGVYFSSLAILFPASFAMTFMDTFYANSLSAVTADLSAPGQNGNTRSMIRGFSRLQLYTLIGGFIGSLFGAKAVSILPLWGLLALDSATFLGSSIWIFRIARQIPAGAPRPDSHNASTSLRTFLKDSAKEWRDGLTAAVSDANRFKHIISQGLIGIAHGLLSATVIGHYKTTLGVSNSMVALAQVNNRIWSFAGAAYVFRTRFGAKALVFTGAGLMTLGYTGMIFAPFVLFLGAYGLQQFGNALVAPTNRALSLSDANPEIRGRVATFRGLVIDAGVLAGNSLALLLIATGGTRWGFATAGICMVTAFLIYRQVSKWA